jgi:hypothetical protein
MTDMLAEIFPGKPRHVNYLINWSTKCRFIYVETPKVGCTTIKQILQYAEYDFDDTYLGSKNHDQLHDRSLSPLKAPRDDPEQFLECLVSDSYFVFSFVRNPFTRILSAYLDKIVGKPNEQSNIQRKMNIDPAIGAPTFSEFIDIVYSSSPVEMNPHWAPQTFLLAIDNVRYDYLGRFEFFNDSIQQLVKSRELKIPSSITGRGKQHSTSADHKLQQYFDANTTSRVKEIYQRDFEQLGYGWSI